MTGMSYVANFCSSRKPSSRNFLDRIHPAAFHSDDIQIEGVHGGAGSSDSVQALLIGGGQPDLMDCPFDAMCNKREIGRSYHVQFRIIGQVLDQFCVTSSTPLCNMKVIVSTPIVSDIKE
jgi:hypothetical protein